MYQVGFDIGGTNIAVGAVSDDMEIVARRSVRFPTGAPYEQTAELLAGLVNEIATELKISPGTLNSIGIAVPGSIDPSREFVLHAYNLQFHNIPLKKCLQAHFEGVPVFLANDADAAALAELHAGVFKGLKTAVLMTLGTGIGGGLILDGRLFYGGCGNGVELGHIVLLNGGPMCTCGTRGCMESVCTAVWLVQQGRQAVVNNPTCMIYTQARGLMDNVTAKLVIDCAKAGDTIALDIFYRYVDNLSSAVASIINLLDPQVIAIGGGVSNAGDFLFEPLREGIKKKAFFPDHGEIMQAKLGNDAGIIGAAMLARNEAQRRI